MAKKRCIVRVNVLEDVHIHVAQARLPQDRLVVEVQTRGTHPDLAEALDPDQARRRLVAV
jgi:hypothetical protein